MFRCFWVDNFHNIFDILKKTNGSREEIITQYQKNLAKESQNINGKKWPNAQIATK